MRRRQASPTVVRWALVSGFTIVIAITAWRLWTIYGLPNGIGSASARNDTAIFVGTILGTLTVTAGGAWAQQGRNRRPSPKKAKQRLGFIGRPGIENEILGHLTLSTRRRNAMVVLEGSGGFGKTSLLERIASIDSIERQFTAGIYKIVLGGNIRPDEIAARIASTIRGVDESYASTTDATQSGADLIRTLDEIGPALVILDDVWTPDQLDPFLFKSDNISLLVATRNPNLMPPSAKRVRVGSMTDDEAVHLILQAVPDLSRSTTSRLIQVTHRWPLLMSLTASAIRFGVERGMTSEAAAAFQLENLQSGGPQYYDDIVLTHPDDRTRLVGVSINASLNFLTELERYQFNQLCIFPEDVRIPLEALSVLWSSPEQPDNSTVLKRCQRLYSLGLITDLNIDNDVTSLSITVHDVIRGYLIVKHRDSVLTWNETIIQACGSYYGLGQPPAKWWLLPTEARYFRYNLIYHMLQAGRGAEAEALLLGVQWVEFRLRLDGSQAAEADLIQVSTDETSAIRRRLATAADFFHHDWVARKTHSMLSTLLDQLSFEPELKSVVSRAKRSAKSGLLLRVHNSPELLDQVPVRTFIANQRSLSACAISADQTWIAVGSLDHTVRLWSLDTGEMLRVIMHDGQVKNCGILGSDSSFLASLADGVVRIINSDSGENVAVIRRRSEISHLACSRNGPWLAICYYGRRETIEVLRFHEGRVERFSKKYWTIDDVITDLQISQDDDMVLAGTYSGSVVAWSLQDRSEMFSVTGAFQYPVYCLGATGLVGTLIASDRRSALAWDLGTGRKVALADEFKRQGFYVARPLSRGFLLAASDAAICSVEDGRVMQLFPGHRRGIVACDASRDQKYILTAGGDGDGTARLFALSSTSTARGSGPSITAIWGRGGDKFKCGQFAPDGASVVAGTYDSIVTWDVTSDVKVREQLKDESWIRDLAISPDGTWAVCVGNERLHCWRLDDGEVVASIPLESPLSSAAIAPSGTWFVTSGADGTAQIRDSRDGVVRYCFEKHSEFAPGSANWIWDCQVGARGDWVVTGAEGGSIAVWDPATGDVIHWLIDRKSSNIVALPSGASFAWCNGRGDINSFNVDTGQLASITVGGVGGGVHLAISPDSRWFAMTSRLDPWVSVWDASSGGQVAALRIDHVIERCRWSPDGTALCLLGNRGINLVEFQAPE